MHKLAQIIPLCHVCISPQLGFLSLTYFQRLLYMYVSLLLW